MRSRLLFAMVTVLFLGMNVWLWRLEIAGKGRFNSSVAPETVWRKMALAQDASSLNILHEGRRIGFCQWRPTVKQWHNPRSDGDDLSVEEMTQEVTSYELDLDGYFLVDDTTRLRFNANLRLDTNFVWRTINLRLVLRPDAWEFSADAAREQVRIHLDDENGRRERTFKFSDLDHPEQVLRHLGVGGLAPMLAGLGLPLGRLQATNLLSGVTWQAQRDHLAMERANVPVFRVQASAFHRPQATAYIGVFGEILRVELPGQVLLLTDLMKTL